MKTKPLQVFWITGLPGSGKSTLARELTRQLRKMNYPTIMIDGDAMRGVLGIQNKFDTESRLELAKTYSRFAKMLMDQNVNVVVATVSLISEIYAFNRELHPQYKEIFLNVPIEVLRRGPRSAQYASEEGVYGKDISIDLPYEPNLVLVAATDDERNAWPDLLVDFVLELGYVNGD